MITKFSVFIIVIIAVTGLDAACPNNPTDAPAPNNPTEATAPVYFE
jgi:hypothetical protein